MANKIKVTLGQNAYSFNDQSTGLSISRGDIIELSPRQANTVRVKRAINQGHLIMVMDPQDPKKYSEDEIKKIVAKLKKQHKSGMEVSKAAKAYSLEEVKLAAESLGYTVEDSDTAESLLTSIFEEFDEEK